MYAVKAHEKYLYKEPGWLHPARFTQWTDGIRIYHSRVGAIEVAEAIGPCASVVEMRLVEAADHTWPEEVARMRHRIVELEAIIREMHDRLNKKGKR